MSIGPKNRVFSTLDIRTGYWQVPLNEETKQLTAFSTPSEHYAFKKMSFGISGAPLAFQRLINSCLQDSVNSVFAFLDNNMIFSKDEKSHLTFLQEVFSRLQSACLTLKLSKCNLLRKKITFFGHVLDDKGVTLYQTRWRRFKSS